MSFDGTRVPCCDLRRCLVLVFGQAASAPGMKPLDAWQMLSQAMRPKSTK